MNCPVCETTVSENKLHVKDNTVSGELFWIAECPHCSLRLTQNVPGQAAIASYYQSENYISHTNTAKGLINRLYHFVRKRTLVRKRRLVEQMTTLNTGKILDIGSGTGSFLQEMKTNGWEATGLEPDEGARKIARQDYGVELEEMNRFYGFPPNSFDAITLWHVLEHVHDLQGYVKQLKNVLKSSGKLIIAVPNYTSLDAAIYKEYWAAYDVPRHLYHFSPRSIQVLMEMNGMSILQYKPMWYDSFYISMLSSKYKNGKTNLFAAAWNGFRSNWNALMDVKKCSSVIYVIGVKE
jgi:SAM-dependent methyltransferase